MALNHCEKCYADQNIGYQHIGTGVALCSRCARKIATIVRKKAWFVEMNMLRNEVNHVGNGGSNGFSMGTRATQKRLSVLNNMADKFINDWLAETESVGAIGP